MTEAHKIPRTPEARLREIACSIRHEAEYIIGRIDGDQNWGDVATMFARIKRNAEKALIIEDERND